MHDRSAERPPIDLVSAWTTDRHEGNQPATHDTVETCFAEAIRKEWRGVGHAQLVPDDAGRNGVDTRCYWTTPDADVLASLNPDGDGWTDLGSVGIFAIALRPSNPRSPFTSKTYTIL